MYNQQPAFALFEKWRLMTRLHFCYDPEKCVRITIKLLSRVTVGRHIFGATSQVKGVEYIDNVARK